MLLSGVLFSQKSNVEFKKVDDLVEATYTYESGKIHQHGYFKNDKLHGEWKYYNENGNWKTIAHYDNGIKTGQWVYKIGNKTRVVTYKDNKIVDVAML